MCLHLVLLTALRDHSVMVVFVRDLIRSDHRVVEQLLGNLVTEQEKLLVLYKLCIRYAKNVASKFLQHINTHTHSHTAHFRVVNPTLRPRDG